MPLRTLVSDEEIALLEAALRWIESASLKAFGLLFEPRKRGGVIPAPPEPVLAPLIAFDLVERAGEGVRGLLRVRRHQGRFFVMEIGLGNEVEYLQDLWPETDALLASLDGLPPCRLLNLGTGCGIVAVEAALSGHSVVATDLYQPTLVLARFNARLNHVAERIEFRQGHLWEPLGDERFDLVLTNPHYGHADDQLRLEVLRGVPEHLSEKGRMLLATALEWDETERVLGVESVLRPLVARGFAVKVEPIESSYKRSWFAVARGEPGLQSRHRFTIAVATSTAPALQVSWPQDPPIRELVPLSRLTRGQHATVTTAADAAVLDELLARLISPEVTLEQPLPPTLLDACRWGAQECVGGRGAAGAILTPDGAIRPCTHGPPLAHAEETLLELNTRYQELAAAARARRECALCPAEPVCSRCLFPVALDDAAYCALIRRHHPRLAILHRLLEAVASLDSMKVPPGSLRLRRWPRSERSFEGVAGEWNRLGAWLIERAGRWFLGWNQSRALIEVDRATAELGAALGEGKPVPAQAQKQFAELLAR